VGLGLGAFFPIYLTFPGGFGKTLGRLGRGVWGILTKGTQRFGALGEFGSKKGVSLKPQLFSLRGGEIKGFSLWGISSQIWGRIHLILGGTSETFNSINFLLEFNLPHLFFPKSFPQERKGGINWFSGPKKGPFIFPWLGRLYSLLPKKKFPRELGWRPFFLVFFPQTFWAFGKGLLGPFFGSLGKYRGSTLKISLSPGKIGVSRAFLFLGVFWGDQHRGAILGGSPPFPPFFFRGVLPRGARWCIVLWGPFGGFFSPKRGGRGGPAPFGEPGAVGQGGF